VLSRWLRRWSPRILGPLAAALARLGISPNQATLAGLALAWLCGALIAIGLPQLAGAAILASGLLDALDGEIARAGGRETALGAFLDSIADHYGDVAIYLGLAWVGLADGEPFLVFFVLLAMFGSIAGSHIRSRAGMLGIETKDVGLFTRAERILVLAFGLLTGYLVPALVVLAAGNNLTALQRLAHVISRASRES
jgi:phosphatidylglycerophosphate synthase